MERVRELRQLGKHTDENECLADERTRSDEDGPLPRGTLREACISRSWDAGDGGWGPKESDVQQHRRIMQGACRHKHGRIQADPPPLHDWTRGWCDGKVKGSHRLNPRPRFRASFVRRAYFLGRDCLHFLCVNSMNSEVTFRLLGNHGLVRGFDLKPTSFGLLSLHLQLIVHEKLLFPLQFPQAPQKKVQQEDAYHQRIGAGLVDVYLSRPNTVVVAGVRDPNHPTSQKLSSVSKDPSSKIIVVKIDNKSETDPAAAVKSIQSQGIDKLDLVIANAGICNDWKPVATVDPEVFKEHVVVNGFAPLFLFQAVLPLLQKSESPKFVGIGSPMGSVGGMDLRPYPMTAYGSSKAIFHWIIRKVHFEHPEIVSLVVDPGLVQTDMGNTGARLFGMAEAPVPTKDSVAGCVAQVCLLLVVMVE
ncbi:MAG: hypothetical protein L6R40_004256 [Gallowayella cf. fulva]|nr:MAG: hypothetical protein L6R40_004256 [Xanthomendoza cf. fulva]